MSGIIAAKRHEGVEYLVYDWQTEAMSERKYQINAMQVSDCLYVLHLIECMQEFYKQEYCGCSYSLRDSNAFRKKEGLPAIVIGAGGTYSDPIADAAEESLETVQSFFDDTHSDAMQDWREEQQEVYKKRRKDVKSGTRRSNNW